MQFIFSMANSAYTSTCTALQSVLKTMNGIKAFVTILFDESGQLEPIWDLSNSLVDSAAFQLALESMKTTPEVAAIVAEQYIAPSHNLEQLLQYPQDSLGYIYAHQMTQLGFQPLDPTISSHRPGKVAISESQYVDQRFQQTHDIWHIITGFDTSEVGEIGLQAVYLAQFQLPLSSLLIANSLIGATLLQPKLLNPMLNAIAQGWHLGKTARPLIAQKWEEAWEKPLVQWHKELNVQPAIA